MTDIVLGGRLRVSLSGDVEIVVSRGKGRTPKCNIRFHLDEQDGPVGGGGYYRTFVIPKYFLACTKEVSGSKAGSH